MAISSKCVSCGKTTFEIKLAEPKGSKYKVYFIQCASCGGVVGTMNYFNINAQILQQNKAIKKIAQALNVYVELDTQ